MTHQVQNLNQNVEEKKTCTHYVFLSPLQYKEQMIYNQVFSNLSWYSFRKITKKQFRFRKATPLFKLVLLNNNVKSMWKTKINK